MRFILFFHAVLQASREKRSAGGMGNAAGSEVGLPVPGLSNRSLYPPASDGVRGRIYFSFMRATISC